MFEKFVVFMVAFFGVLAVAAGLGFFFGWLLMIGINYVFAPSFLIFIFGVPAIPFWKAYVLSFVTGVLFKAHVTSK